ncbi:MAG TPA: hypothetical protein DDZ80_20955 [Cyanobacteria bacterium UBA8803]|nr:hypothetical protein [Cyanobacteria bacterium UBA9273]HBL60814.1 hypothetical protein [Cyanobacteria bacterium UBA8803]
MKCIRCGTDNNLRDRTINQGRCKNCNHPFVFEPADVRDARFKFTDPFFAKAIADISANNTLYFTPQQLFYLLDRRLSRNRLSPNDMQWGFFIIAIFIILASINKSKEIFYVGLPFGLIIPIYLDFRDSNSPTININVRRQKARSLQIWGGLILLGGILLSLGLNSYILFAGSVIVGMGSIYLGYRQLGRQSQIPQAMTITQNQFQDWINRWQRINDPITKMLPAPRQESLPTPVSAEISAYSFDRAVICDSAAIAQLLIANNFHFENNCAVLSSTGYPQNIFNTVMEMLFRNPDLKVYAIHDASPNGVSLVHQLRSSPNWFQNRNVMIYDLGLLPRQCISSRNMFMQASANSAQQAQQMPQEVRQSLSSNELAWLDAGNFVELESFSPQRILQVLTQGITRSQNVTDSDSLVVIDSDVGYVYAVDTFG